MIVLLVILNLVISAFNAWSVGHTWAETKTAGGWARFMSWMGAIMAASGFTWCFTAILGGIIYATGYMSDKYVHAIFSLGYLVVILPVLGSGLAITIESWAYFWRRRSLLDGAVATWNTFAQVSNMLQALSAIPDAISGVGDIFEGDDDSNPLVILVFAAVAVALAAGVLVTMAIIRKTAKSHARSVREDFFDRMEARKARGD